MLARGGFLQKNASEARQPIAYRGLFRVAPYLTIDITKKFIHRKDGSRVLITLGAKAKLKK